MKTRLFLVVGILAGCLLPLCCCTDTTIDNTTIPRHFSHVNDAEARWRAHGIKRYTLAQTRLCFCAPRSYPLTLDIDSGGKVVAARDMQGNAVNTNLGKSIEEMFAEIRALQNRTDASVEAEYDSVYGYPRSLNADPIKRAADDEYTLQTRLVR